jgi:hypothetical protein
MSGKYNLDRLLDSNNNDDDEDDDYFPDGEEIKRRSDDSPSTSPPLNTGKLPANNKQQQRTAPDAALRRMMKQAAYEVTYDAYRGIAATSQKAFDANPWLVCSAAPAPPIPDVDDGATNVVVYVTNTACPSLLHWTREAQRKAKQRKKPTETAFGIRQSSCSCDYNPFCLVSLGGIMNDILIGKFKRRMQKRNSTGNIVTNGTWCSETTATPRMSRTKDRVAALRQSEWRPKKVIRTHLQRILRALTNVESTDSLMNTLANQHAQLLFENSVDDEVEETEHDDDQLRLAIPPGIENLGATCYLNTQLQCLARILPFVDGIFSWKRPHTTDKMSQVILLFQTLLAQMRIGPHRKLTAIELASALGLDHGEQQDPNEFSRLLFARMGESFQATDDGLATLLSDLFRGSILYQTTCLECKNKTKRQDYFEDLNLPIVKPTKKKKSGQQALRDYFTGNSSKADTDVQFCFDNYLKEEMLQGDNQYFCSLCDRKVDAVRKPLIQTLPPVLNIQLCRYIYDRERGEKKKLGDKVLLPRELVVEAKGKERKVGVDQYKYLLCAIMRHKGNSAYRGHYVAEALDWQTGEWFEFNDATVTLLKEGPACSYYPAQLTDHSSAEKDVDGKKIDSVTGSNEAYNMYYVDETCLASSVWDSLRKERASTASQSTESQPVSEPTVIEKVVMDRAILFASVQQ